MNTSLRALARGEFHWCKGPVRSIGFLVEGILAGDPDARMMRVGSRRYRHGDSAENKPMTCHDEGDRRGDSGKTAPVVIAGGGPTGLTTSLLLAEYGVESIVLEKSPHLPRHPKAHLMNHRTLEIFRHVSGLSEDIVRLMPGLKEWRNFVYCTSLTGSLLGIVDHFKVGIGIDDSIRVLASHE